MIEKAVKQVYHVYPFFNAEIIMFSKILTTQLKVATNAAISKSKASSKSISKARPAKWIST